MEVKPLAGLTKTLRVLLKIDIGILVLAIFAGFYEYNSYANLPSGIDPTKTLLPSDILIGIVGLTQFIFFIILGITFLRWIYRTNKNLHILSGEQMTFTPGWSVGWYFIPIANLFKPKQAMKEIWKVSHKNESTTHAILGWWWFFWIVSNFINSISFKLAKRAEYSVASTISFIVSDGIDLILNIVALMLVTRIGRAYSKNFIEQGAALDGDSATLPPRQ
jgi:hypothetical protein